MRFDWCHKLWLGLLFLTIHVDVVDVVFVVVWKNNITPSFTLQQSTRFAAAAAAATFSIQGGRGGRGEGGGRRRTNKESIQSIQIRSQANQNNVRAFMSRYQKRSSVPKIMIQSERVVTSLSAGYNWDEISYNLQSFANSLASVSLTEGDPSNLLTSLPIMYGAGLLTSASPCVWGLLPLTMSYISQAAGERSDHKTTVPALAFAAGLATVFCTLGVAAVELGGVFGSSSSNNGATVLAILSNAICLAMGLKLLDFVQFRIPSFAREMFLSLSSTADNLFNDGRTLSSSSSQAKQPTLILVDGTGKIMTSEELSRKRADKSFRGGTDGTYNEAGSVRKENGSLFRTFLLGGSSALVASPCATPVLTSILAFVASASNPALGALLLLTYTAGYSTPLLVVAATGGQALENLRSKSQSTSGDDTSSSNNFYSVIGPWVTPLTGGILLWYGTDGMLNVVLGDPSLAGMQMTFFLQ